MDFIVVLVWKFQYCWCYGIYEQGSCIPLWPKCPQLSSNVPISCLVLFIPTTHSLQGLLFHYRNRTKVPSDRKLSCKSFVNTGDILQWVRCSPCMQLTKFSITDTPYGALILSVVIPNWEGYSVLLRDYSWYCAQELILVVLKESFIVEGIELGQSNAKLET